MNESLNKSASWFKISFFRRNSILQVILFGPEALMELRTDMMLAMSSLSVVCSNIVLLVSFERYSEKCLCEYFMLFCSLSYRGKVIMKSIHNIEIGYSITIIKGAYPRYKGCYSF